MSKLSGPYFDVGNKARDLLYKDYGKQPPTYFNYQCFKWNFDLSCETPEILPGLSTVFRFTIPDSSKVQLRFLNDYVGISCGAGVKSCEQGSFKGNGYYPFVSFSGAAGTTLFSLGTEIVFNVSTGEFDNVSAGFGFNGPLLLTSLTMDDKLDTLRASCYREFSPITKTAVAAELKHNFSSNGTTSLTVGAQHELFPFTLLKARMNTDAKVGALVQVELWEKLLLGFTGEVDLRGMNKMSKAGFSVSMRP